MMFLATVLPTALSSYVVANAAEKKAAANAWTRIRRVVTTSSAEGGSRIVADGEPANSIVLNGTRITRLWESSGIPVPLPLLSDGGVTAGNAYREGFVGTSFYVAEIPGGERAPVIPMHQNSTLDYMAILSGRIFLKLPDYEVELNAGDTLVQGGNLHTFENRRAESCLLLFVVVSGASRTTVS